MAYTSENLNVGDFVALRSDAVQWTSEDTRKQPTTMPSSLTGTSIVYQIAKVGNSYNSQYLQLKSPVTNGSQKIIHTLCKCVDTIKHSTQGSGSKTITNTSATDSVKDAEAAFNKSDSSTATSGGIDSGLTNMYNDASSYNDLTKSYINASTRLFGMPYQFMSSVDPRVDSISSTLGIEYCRNIVSEAPILTIIPGHPKYLDGHEAKADEITSQFINANNSLNKLNGYLSGEKMETNYSKNQLKYYGFQDAYLEYMNYVNLMCRTAAGLLGISGRQVNNVPLSKYDWKNYRYETTQYTVGALSVVEYLNDNFFSAIGQWAGDRIEDVKKWLTETLDSLTGRASTATTSKVYSMNASLYDSLNGADGPREDVTYEDSLSNDDKEQWWSKFMDVLETNMNYVQFYIDPGSFNENASNQTGSSTLENLLTNSAGTTLKEFQFIVNSSGASQEQLSQMATFTEGTAQSLLNALNSSTTSNGIITPLLSRVANVGNNIISGDTMIFPQIYTGSEYSKGYNITITLKTPYGNKFSYYMDILVPLFHLVALTMPRQSTANTYSSPFIIKASIPGIMNCSLGIVDSITIDKNVSGEGLSVDGYPLEVKVGLNIKDLYSDLMITPSTDPALFVTNSGLMEYLAINCGLDLTRPDYATKINTYVGAAIEMANDIPANVGYSVATAFTELLQKGGWLV